MLSRNRNSKKEELNMEGTVCRVASDSETRLVRRSRVKDEHERKIRLMETEYRVLGKSKRGSRCVQYSREQRVCPRKSRGSEDVMKWGREGEGTGRGELVFYLLLNTRGLYHYHR